VADRAVSTVDPDTRHIHKNRTRHQDGFKGHASPMVEHTTVVHTLVRDRTHRGGWVEHDPTGCAVVRCSCGLDSGRPEALAAQIADDHRRTPAEARM
ncbi:hypothetical protein ACFWJA_45950, partial [Streptomyces cadmiisoli]